jgi:hypothetical protein
MGTKKSVHTHSETHPWPGAGCRWIWTLSSFCLRLYRFGEENSVCASRLRPPPYGVRIEVGTRLRLTGIGNIRRASQSHRTWVGWHIGQLFFKVRCLVRHSVALSEVAREVSGPLDSSNESRTGVTPVSLAELRWISSSVPFTGTLRRCLSLACRARALRSSHVYMLYLSRLLFSQS